MNQHHIKLNQRFILVDGKKNFWARLVNGNEIGLRSKMRISDQVICNNCLMKSWYCFLPVSTKVCNAAITDSSAQFRLWRVTSSGKSSKKGLPIRLMVSQRPSTCLGKVFCDARPCSW